MIFVMSEQMYMAGFVDLFDWYFVALDIPPILLDCIFYRNRLGVFDSMFLVEPGVFLL